MEDYHVDRPGVEAQQCVKLTGTNNSIGLIVLITHVHFGGSLFSCSKPDNMSRKGFERPDAFRRPGGYCEVAAPVPIPNTAVKRLSADGTLS